MFPVGPIIAAVVAMRFAVGRRGKAAVGRKAERDRTGRGHPLLRLMTGDGLFSASLVTLVAAPLGLARFAWWVERYCGTGLLPRERGPRALLVASQVLARHPEAKRPAAFDTALELASAGAAGQALLAAQRGDLALARGLARAIVSMGEDEADPRALTTARDVLAVDAATQGRWAYVLDLSRSWRPSRRRLLLRGVARCMVGDARAPSPRRLRMLWLLAPYRRASACLLALQPSPRDAATAKDLAPTQGLRAVAHLVALPAVVIDQPSVAAAVASLDRLGLGDTLASELAPRIAARFATARGVDASAIAAQVLAQAESDLADVLLDGEHPTTWLPRTAAGDRVRDRVRATRLERLDVAVRELQRRLERRLDLPEVEEWSLWGQLRWDIEVARRDAATPEEMRSLYQTVQRTCTSHAVRLCNVRTRRTLSGAMLLTMKELAHAAGAREDYDHVDRNADAWRSDRLPRELTLGGEPLSDTAATKRGRRRGGFEMLAFVGLGGVACLGIFKLDPGIGALGITLWMALIVSTSMRVQRIAEAGITADGLAIQTLQGRFIAQPADIVAMRVAKRGEIQAQLRRRPFWLRPRLRFFAPDVATATERVAAYVARHGVTERSRS